MGVIVGGEYVTTDTTSVLDVGELVELVCNVGTNNDIDDGYKFDDNDGVGDDVVVVVDITCTVLIPLVLPLVL